ncbi:hypothetical protein HK099_004478 [Clydaea vesicula]|uniref:Uncharacterized protein n=1 Tax=Clydaea vesicula TaxID=447962 RepID=A0AAD5XY73_9FUNG|nr:hypothetical protein HK099_004478 [Clydaea vesicula]KAJ3384780.1 hypothetical protein HDU92_003419 [Lobulomyces angularis]
MKITSVFGTNTFVSYKKASEGKKNTSLPNDSVHEYNGSSIDKATLQATQLNTQRLYRSLCKKLAKVPAYSRYQAYPKRRNLKEKDPRKDRVLKRSICLRNIPSPFFVYPSAIKIQILKNPIKKYCRYNPYYRIKNRQPGDARCKRGEKIEFLNLDSTIAKAASKSIPRTPRTKINTAGSIFRTVAANVSNFDVTLTKKKNVTPSLPKPPGAPKKVVKSVDHFKENKLVENKNHKSSSKDLVDAPRLNAAKQLKEFRLRKLGSSYSRKLVVGNSPLRKEILVESMIPNVLSKGSEEEKKETVPTNTLANNNSQVSKSYTETPLRSLEERMFGDVKESPAEARKRLQAEASKKGIVLDFSIVL